MERKAGHPSADADLDSQFLLLQQGGRSVKARRVLICRAQSSIADELYRAFSTLTPTGRLVPC
eukprot:scaffold402165_cov25-Prasinocladus_malaysianus.AAC.1